MYQEDWFMMLHMLWVLVSFFAVIGLLECILGVLELLALRRVRSVRQAVFRVELTGDEPHMEYLLNTLSLMADRVDVGAVETVLEVVDRGLNPISRRELEQYCEKNPWVIFTEAPENDII